MQAGKLIIVQTLYKWGFLTIVALLPMSHTVALRNIVMALMLLLLPTFFLMQYRQFASLLESIDPPPSILFVWFAFLLCFPIWAVYPEDAWVNLRGQWLASMLAWLLGFGAVWVLDQKTISLWELSLASAFSVLLHLVVLLVAWVGLLGPDLPTSLSYGEALKRLSDNFMAPSLSIFPLGFSGVEPMHGNLGYTACQAVVVLMVVFLFAWRSGQLRMLLGSAVLIGLCFTSVLAASSRGAFLYAFLILPLAAGLYYWKFKVAAPQTSSMILGHQLMLIASFVLIAGVVFTIALNSVTKDARWQTMTDKVRVAFMPSQPLSILCEGIPSQLKEKIQSEFGYRGEAYVQSLIQGLSQDGGRILLMRVGVELVLENPRGLDGGRTSYMNVIADKCEHEPELLFAHLHQSWIDLSLALGWIGAGLFACLLLYFFSHGWKVVTLPAQAPFAMAMILVCAFWFLRGFTDSVYREHYLQMQALVIAYLFGQIHKAPSVRK